MTSERSRTLLVRTKQDRFHLAGRLILHPWQNMRVNVERHPRGSVPEPFRCHLRVDTLGEEHRGVCVAEISSDIVSRAPQPLGLLKQSDK